MGSWRVVDESRPPCPQGARHILQLAGKGFAGRAGVASAGGGEGGPGRLRVGGQAAKGDASGRRGRLPERMLSRPRAPGERPAQVRGRRRAEGLRRASQGEGGRRSTPGRLESGAGSGDGSRSALESGWKKWDFAAGWGGVVGMSLSLRSGASCDEDGTRRAKRSNAC